MTTTLLTGLPRSGTTLLCALLNDVPNTVALAEPISGFSTESAEALILQLKSFIYETRRRALQEHVVPSKTVRGKIEDNFAESPSSAKGLRKVLAVTEQVTINKHLTEDFHLFIKEPALFTALLNHLSEHFEVKAIVRHPLAVLASWQTVEMPVNKGRMPLAEAYAPELRASLDLVEDRIARQIYLLRYLFRCYDSLPNSQILRYEDLISHPEFTLKRLTPYAGTPKHLIYNYGDLAQRYPGVDIKTLARKLKPFAADFQRFYPDRTT